MTKYKQGDVVQMHNYEFEGGSKDREAFFKSDCIIIIDEVETHNKNNYYYKVSVFLISKNRWETNHNFSSSYYDDKFEPIDGSLDYYKSITVLFKEI